MKGKKENIVYFAHPIYMYSTKQVKSCIDLINKNIINKNIINPGDYDKQVKKIIKEYGNNENILNNKLFFKLVDKCDIFCYYLKNKITPGIAKELNYALSKNKKIYMINDSFEIIKMNKQNINSLIKNYYTTTNNSWVLNSINDYSTFFGNNSEISKFIVSQFDVYKSENKGILNHAIIPHFNSVYITKDLKNVVLDDCSQHQMKHSFVSPNYQEKIAMCPFTNIGTTKPGYSKFKLDHVNQVNIDNLLLKARTLHKSMYIFDKDVFTRGKGIVLRDEHDKPVYTRFETVADLSKVLGVEIVFDLDIVSELKNRNTTFFNKKTFDEFCKVIPILQNFVEDFWNIEYKMGFSGNGIYLYLPPFLFEDFDFDFESFSTYFKDKRLQINSIFKENKISRVELEKKYGWNRYFKIMGTFHLKHERLAIPLNNDESLDYDWMKEITDISTGLEGNVFNEILKKSNWR